MLAQDVWEGRKNSVEKDNEYLAFALDRRALGCTVQITFTPKTSLADQEDWGKATSLHYPEAQLSSPILP